MKFVQFDPMYCEEAKGAPMTDFDSSHDVSVIYDDGTRARAATFKHAEWAGLFQDMMNAREDSQ